MSETYLPTIPSFHEHLSGLSHSLSQGKKKIKPQTSSLEGAKHVLTGFSSRLRAMSIENVLQGPNWANIENREMQKPWGIARKVVTFDFYEKTIIFKISEPGPFHVKLLNI